MFQETFSKKKKESLSTTNEKIKALCISSIREKIFERQEKSEAQLRNVGENVKGKTSSSVYNPLNLDEILSSSFALADKKKFAIFAL